MLSTTLDLFIALAILSPIELPAPEQAPPILWSSLRRVAGSLELVGPHENWAPNFASELRYCRRYAWSLAESPSIHDASRFRLYGQAQPHLELNRRFYAILEAQEALHPWHGDQYRELRAETARLGDIWTKLCVLTDGHYAWVSKRGALLELRELLGEEAYWRGIVPHPVPVWRFIEVD